MNLVPLRKERCPNHQDTRVDVLSRTTHRMHQCADVALEQRPGLGHVSEAVALPCAMTYTGGTVQGRSGQPGQSGAAVGGSPWPSGQDCGPPGSREPVAQPGCNGARSKAARVPAEPGTILPLCAWLLGAEETKRKCQERVNQTRYSVTITSFSGLLGPRAPRAQAGHLRGAHSRSWGPVARVCC